MALLSSSSLFALRSSIRCPISPVSRRPGGRDELAADLIAPLELPPERDLLDAFGRDPSHREHFFFRAKGPLRMAVALEAPRHLEPRSLPDERHLVDAAVTGLAADALVHVDGVVEVDEVG